MARLQLVRTLRDRVTEGLPASGAVDRLRAAGTPELPPDPTPEQLDAWLELAELAADEDFQRTTRANALWGAEAAGAGFDPDAWSRRTAGGLAAATARPSAAGWSTSSTPTPTPGPSATGSWSASSRAARTGSSWTGWPTTPGCWPPSATTATTQCDDAAGP